MTSVPPASPAPSPPAGEGLETLCEQLWRERDLLERLEYRVAALVALLRTDVTCWSGPADADVQDALAQVAECELLRAMTVDAVARSIGLDGAVTLRVLADHVDEPWGTLLHDHQRALRSGLDALDRTVAEAGRWLAGDGCCADASGLR